MTPTLSEPPDEWRLRWRSPFQTHAYEPLCLANGHFGGTVDLSGATMELWSPRIGAVPRESSLPPGVRLPVTLLRTQVYFANAYLRRAGLLAGASGIHCSDSRYTSDPSMPHVAQVYDCRQELDLRGGVARTEGRLFLGSQAGLEAGVAPEREVAFRTRLAFVRDLPVAGFAVEAEPDTEIVFAPETVLEEHFELHLRGRGIARLGNAIDCRLHWEQTLEAVRADPGRIRYDLTPHGATPYAVEIEAPGAELTRLNGRPALRARGRIFVAVTLVPDGAGTAEPARRFPAWDELEAEQRRRWGMFWDASDVRLPPGEALWQQRYRASLFHVAQSLGEGPTHPGGFGRPMFPYWYGCFHDTDTYFCRALLESGRGEAAARHLAYRHRHLGEARRTARGLGRSGALYPWQTDMDGRGGAHDVPVNGAIIAREAWHHFQHTRTPSALRQSRDILAETLDNLADHLDREARPLRLRPVPLMTFSETMRGTEPTEVRLALRAVAEAYLEACRRAGDGEPARRALAERILTELGLPVRPDGSYALAGDGDPAYQRCPSVILGSFPLHCLPADEALARTFEKELGRIVFLFAWLPHQASVVASQLGRRTGSLGAASLLRQADVYYKPWHAYDEWENRRTVRAANFVTAAGGFCLALHALLLAETAPGVWRLFPAAPEDWRDVAFARLTVRAGWVVSATRRGGRTVAIDARPVDPDASDALTLECADADPAILEGAGGECRGTDGVWRIRLTPDRTLTLGEGPADLDRSAAGGTR